jgi:hypothetical protein
VKRYLIASIVCFVIVLGFVVYALAGEKEDLQAQIAVYQNLMTRWEGEANALNTEYNRAMEAVQKAQARIREIEAKEKK